MTRLTKVAVVGAGWVKAENPIRRIVTLMQNMNKEIEEEVRVDEEHFKKFMCSCKKDQASLSDEISDDQMHAKQAGSEADGFGGLKKQLAEEIKKHKAERSKAEKDLEAATQKRTEEQQEYEAESQKNKKTLADLEGAIAALEKGQAKSFLQTGAAKYLSTVLQNSSGMLDMLDLNDQQVVMSFLQSGTQTGSSEIVGILKTMKDNFTEAQASTEADEKKAAAAYEEMKQTLSDLSETSGKQIEKKMEEAGQTAVKFVQKKNQKVQLEEQVADNQKTLAELKTSCKDRETSHAEDQKDAAAEVEAIGQAIQILNNDDALATFNKSDAKASGETSLLQVSARRNSPEATVNSMLSGKSFAQNPAIAMLAYTVKQGLRSKQVDFSKVMGMIDNMVTVLKDEGASDLDDRDSCTKELNENESQKKELQRDIESVEAAIEDNVGVIAEKADLIAKAKKRIAENEQAMAEGTKQRQEENAAFVASVDMNKQAVELILKAKDKLNAYYNPDLVRKDQPEEEGAAEPALMQREKKSQQSGGVMALMDTMIADLNKTNADLEKHESIAQVEYERMAADLAKSTQESRVQITEASSAKGQVEEEKVSNDETLSNKQDALLNTETTIADLHKTCDFLLKNFEVRAEARAKEIDGLDKAKAVLSGAKFD